MPALSNSEKREIGQLAREAFLAWPGRAEFLECNAEISESAAFTAWRHWQQGLACGCQSLRAVSGVGDVRRLRAHFFEIAGRTEDAAAERIGLERELAARESQVIAYSPEQIARYKLNEALRERGLQESYAAVICRRQFRIELADATAKQLWCLIFTVRNRRKAA